VTEAVSVLVTDIQEFMPYEGHNVTGNFIDIVHHGIFWSSSDNLASTSWYSAIFISA
jgi:hypothetical protein